MQTFQKFLSIWHVWLLKKSSNYQEKFKSIFICTCSIQIHYQQDISSETRNGIQSDNKKIEIPCLATSEPAIEELFAICS